jgi:3-hydroxyisobutyrate dehydrogenase-like beta-hydroxyacid dehydrogenase
MAKQYEPPDVIGFIGLGSMGLPMATNLVKTGYTVRAWNRTAARGEPLARMGATLVLRPEDVAEPGGLIISSLADDTALEEVIGNNEELLHRLGQGGVHLSMSTVAPATSRRLAEGHARHGATYLAAPVLGRPDAAAAGKLWIFVSGPAAAHERVRPVLRVLGQGDFLLGEDAGAANVAKLACNFLIASAMEALAEAFTMAEKSGLARTTMADLVAGTIFNCPAYRSYGRLIAEGRYEPALFKLSLGLKDIRLVLQAADSSRTPMPLASLVHDHFLAALAKGRSDWDWTALAAEVSEDAGLPVPRPREQAG